MRTRQSIAHRLRSSDNCQRPCQYVPNNRFARTGNCGHRYSFKNRPGTENPRVGGSIPPLATTPTFLKRMGFPASPADYRRPRGAEIDRPSDFRKPGRSRAITTRCGRRPGELETWNSANVCGVGARRVDAGPPLPGVPAWGALGRRPWPPPWPDPARPGCREGRDFSGSPTPVLAKASTA